MLLIRFWSITKESPEPRPFLISFLPLSWRAVGSYRPHLEAQPLHQTVSWLRFSGVFLSCKANARRSVYSPQDYLIIILIFSDRRDRCDTRGKWPLGRNPDRSWWHRHTSLNLFWPQPMAPWAAVELILLINKLCSEWLGLSRHQRQSMSLPEITFRNYRNDAHRPQWSKHACT